MEVLGTEFGGMSPQELAAPVNTVAVSLDKTSILYATSTEALMLI